LFATIYYKSEVVGGIPKLYTHPNGVNVHSFNKYLMPHGSTSNGQHQILAIDENLKDEVIFHPCHHFKFWVSNMAKCIQLRALLGDCKIHLSYFLSPCTRKSGFLLHNFCVVCLFDMKFGMKVRAVDADIE